MKPLTLAEIEQELLDIAYGLDGYGSWRADSANEKLRALARRIAVQIETDKLAA